MPAAEQHRTLSQKLVGHFAYYGITGNSVALSLFRRVATQYLEEMAIPGGTGMDTSPGMSSSRFWNTYPLPPPIAIHSVCRRVART